MRDDLSLEMRRLVDNARRDEVPADAGSKRRIRLAVSLGIPASTLFGSSLAAASGTAANTGAGALLGKATVGKVSGWLLQGFWGWVATGSVIGIGVTTVYIGWHGILESAQPNRSSASGAAVVAQQQPVHAPTPTRTAQLPAPIESATSTPILSPPASNPAVTGAQTSSDVPKVLSVADEVALLARVQQKLRDGQGGAALEAIDEANRRFAHGQLEPDFQAARVLAWCEMGQGARARRAANDFLRAHGTSPMAERVRHSCAFSRDNTESSPAEPSEGQESNGSPR